MNQRGRDLVGHYGAAQAPTAFASGEYVTGPPLMPPAAGPVPSPQPTSSPLTDVFPPTQTIAVAGFSRLKPPTSFSSLPTSGPAVWYSLIDLDPSEFLGQESALFAASISISSPDCDPSAQDFPVDASAWGSRVGGNAYLVIGDALPIGDASRWNVAPCPLPGVSSADSLEDGRPGYFYVQPFPGGCLRDSTPVHVELRPAWSPYVFRQAFGRRVQVAVVFHCNDVRLAAFQNKWMYGQCLVQLHSGLKEHPVAYTPVRA